MQIEEYSSLKDLNTFRIDATAQYFARVDSIEALKAIVHSDLWQNQPHFILGGGSNIVLPQHFAGFMLKNEILGKTVLQETADHVWIKAGAGEQWHAFVLHCIAQGFAGVENLSLIPGCVGATPIQNIGAYGVELKDVFSSLTAMHTKTGAIREFNHDECAFGYRDSVFKQALKNQYIVLDVTLKLDKQPTFHVEYKGIKEILAEQGIDTLSIRAISDAVIALRQSKLPDPRIVPNAGSFFKNPVISIDHFKHLLTIHPDMPHFQVPNAVKIPAGWLIEQAGWKGKRVGPVGVYDKQALVLVNYDNGSSEDILTLAKCIQNDVDQQFGIALEAEVQAV